MYVCISERVEFYDSPECAKASKPLSDSLFYGSRLPLAHAYAHGCKPKLDNRKYVNVVTVCQKNIKRNMKKNNKEYFRCFTKGKKNVAYKSK